MRIVLLAAFCLVAMLSHLPSASAAEVFSHDEWTQVLQRFVDDQGLVDYAALATDRASFDLYLRRLERQSPDSHPQLFPSEDHELAYWINAYNAQVFNGVLDRGPDLDTVWGFTGTGVSFFRLMSIQLGGDKTNLQALENEIIRERYGDPRIHAAINCASLSCPRLPRQAFTGDDLDAQLDAAMQEFARAPQHVEVDTRAKKARLSKIFDWFEGDFLSWEKEQGSRSPSVVDYVNRYRADGRKIPDGYKVEFLDYDKALNAQG